MSLDEVVAFTFAIGMTITVDLAQKQVLISFQCDLCDPPKGFHTRTNLREHMNVHSNERPHKCKFCGAGFNSAGNRFAHERSSHLGIKRKK